MEKVEKIITRYKAEDGKIFDSPDACKIYEVASKLVGKWLYDKEFERIIYILKVSADGDEDAWENWYLTYSAYNLGYDENDVYEGSMSLDEVNEFLDDKEPLLLGMVKIKMIEAFKNVADKVIEIMTAGEDDE